MKATHLAVAAFVAATSLFGATSASAELRLATRVADALSNSVDKITSLATPEEREAYGLPAAGDTFHLFQTAGDWFIFVNANTGTCLAEKFDANMNAVQFGKTQDGQAAFLAVYTQLPEEYRKGGQKTTLTVGDVSQTGKLGRRQRASGQAYTGAYVTSSSYDFLTQATYATSTVKMWRKELETVISLEGSTEALQATLDCNAAQGA
ncbi:MAG: hypothetical protein CML68_15780 [Rhodobacteraceae bacterium]|nr:hypothetical protein [Paracoccaceae bacterium]